MTSDPLAILASIAILQFFGWLTPGANLVAISSASMTRGRAMGVATAGGISVGVAVWAAMAVFGIAFLFDAVPPLFIAFKLAGALFLGWLGYSAIRSALAGKTSNLTGASGPDEMMGAFRRGFLVLMTNPKAPIFFGALLTSFLPFGAPNWLMAAIVLEFLVVSFVLNSLTALVFSTQPVMAWFGRNQITINLFIGMVYLLLGGMVILGTLG